MLIANAIPNKVLANILRSGKFVGWCKEMASDVQSSVVVNSRLRKSQRYEADQLLERTLSGVG